MNMPENFITILHNFLSYQYLCTNKQVNK